MIVPELPDHHISKKRIDEQEDAFIASDTMKGAHLLIGVPTNHALTHTDFWMSLLFQRYPQGMKISYKMAGSHSVGWMRNEICDYALEYSATHVVMFDTDMIYPNNMIARHLMHMETEASGLEERPRVINCMSVTKTMEHSPLFFPARPGAVFGDCRRGWPTVDGSPTAEPISGLQQAWICGGAGLMIKTDVLKEIRIDLTERPFFYNHGLVTEDKIFGESCADIGIPMYTDIDLIVAHCGTFSVAPLHIEDDGWGVQYWNTPPSIEPSEEAGKDLMRGHKS